MVMIGRIICHLQLLYLLLPKEKHIMESNKTISGKATEKSHIKELRDLKERKDAETKVLEKLMENLESEKNNKIKI